MIYGCASCYVRKVLLFAPHSGYQDFLVPNVIGNEEKNLQEAICCIFLKFT